MANKKGVSKGKKNTSVVPTNKLRLEWATYHGLSEDKSIWYKDCI
jgi:hypothetical protein